MRKDEHLSDQQLLSSADGELSRQQASCVQAHLASCWPCRTRMAEIEASVRDFIRFHQQIDSHNEISTGSRAMLRARLAELASVPQPPRPVPIGRPLDLDHIGTEPVQHLRAGRSGLVVREVYYANAFESLTHLRVSFPV